MSHGPKTTTADPISRPYKRPRSEDRYPERLDEKIDIRTTDSSKLDIRSEKGTRKDPITIQGRHSDDIRPTKVRKTTPKAPAKLWNVETPTFNPKCAHCNRRWMLDAHEDIEPFEESSENSCSSTEEF